MPFSEWLIVICIFLSNFWNIQCEDPGTFWHITDIHVDLNYSKSEKKLNVCQNCSGHCKDNGIYGNFLCDTPWVLLNLTISSMYSIQNSADFIIWTGDNIAHSTKDHPDWNEIYTTKKNMTTLFKSIFPNTPILPSIGNHDTFPPNTLPTDNSSSSIYRGYLQQGGWIELLNITDTSTFEKGGYYSMLVKTNLRVISLNTVLWQSQNKLTANITDPASQFQWLQNVLQNSSVNSEKVYIIGHIPPGHYSRVSPGNRGSRTYHSKHLESYLKIIFNYTSIIAGQFYGHFHLDMFQIFRKGSGEEFKVSSLLAPPVTPWFEGKGQNVSLPVNPSIRLIYYSPTDFKLLDYSQYIFNLTKANCGGKEKKNTYELLYSFTKYYGVEDLTIKSLVKVFGRLKSSFSLFDDFFKFLTAGMETLDCNQTCRVALICAMIAISPLDYNTCWDGVTNLPSYMLAYL